jgi:hypothetical protein
MVEHWISAAQAREIVGVTDPICVRLHAGLIRARARMLTIDNKTVSDMPVPKQMWWAEGQGALDQDWQAGDFATWIDRDQRVKAVGVTFPLSDILAMIDAERRPMITRSLSVAGNPAWIQAIHARRLAYEMFGSNPVVAGQMIIEKARLGLVVARAVLAQGSTGARGEDDWSWEEREWDVAPWFWENFVTPGSSTQDWQTGKFSGRGWSPTKVRCITLSSVYFHRESLEAPGQPQAEDDSEIARGRRPTYDWAKAVSAIWGMLNRGELFPDVQADVEKALIKYLVKGDREPSESTVRPYAKVIWDEFRKD